MPRRRQYTNVSTGHHRWFLLLACEARHEQMFWYSYLSYRPLRLYFVRIRVHISSYTTRYRRVHWLQYCVLWTIPVGIVKLQVSRLVSSYTTAYCVHRVSSARFISTIPVRIEIFYLHVQWPYSSVVDFLTVPLSVIHRPLFHSTSPSVQYTRASVVYSTYTTICCSRSSLLTCSYKHRKLNFYCTCSRCHQVEWH